MSFWTTTVPRGWNWNAFLDYVETADPRQLQELKRKYTYLSGALAVAGLLTVALSEPTHDGYPEPFGLLMIGAAYHYFTKYMSVAGRLKRLQSASEATGYTEQPLGLLWWREGQMARPVPWRV